MSRALSNTTAYIEVDGREYRLGQDRDLVDMMHRIEGITRSEPAFVDVSDGDNMVSILISPGARVVFSVRRNGLPLLEDDVEENFSLDSPFRDWEM